MNESGSAALSGLFDLTSRRLLRLAVTITRNQHDAEDAVQSTLVRVADRPDLLIRAEHPWPYLLRMARNESLLILRRRKRTLEAQRSNLPIESLSDLISHTPIDQAEQEETHRAVWSALRKLPTEQSEVVVLKVWEGLTFAQIADVLEVNASTVASRYRYALEKLSQKLRSPRSEAANGR